MTKIVKILLSLFGMLLFLDSFAQANLTANNQLLNDGFTKIDLVSPQNMTRLIIQPGERQEKIKAFCREMGKAFAKYSWEAHPCGKTQWSAVLQTDNGHPLIFKRYGHSGEVTLILGGVHPDELTPIPIAFLFARHLEEHPEAYAGTSVIIAPIANPDGFLREDPTRTNARGVDINRNFFTLDWYDRAMVMWKKRGHSRYYPGKFPNSEIETLFQIKLIEEYRPSKILSIHSPLGFLDYDGPGDRKPDRLSGLEKRSKDWVHEIARRAKGYRVVDYSFYPGSLGNFAGNERHIPTVTLELQTANPSMAQKYWEKFLPSMLQSISYPVRGHNKYPDLKAEELQGGLFHPYRSVFAQFGQSEKSRR